MVNNEKVNKTFALYKKGRKLKYLAIDQDVPEKGRRGDEKTSKINQLNVEKRLFL